MILPTIRHQAILTADEFPGELVSVLEAFDLTIIVGFRYSRVPTMKSDLSKASPLSAATLHILLALADEDLHGYGIIQKAGRQSQQKYKLGPGTLYDNLKKLMDLRLVVDSPKSVENSEDEKRLYRLTPEGRTALTAELDRLRNVLREAELVVRAKRPRRV
jgi:DNA-binding PadR family transcriptional regulator